MFILVNTMSIQNCAAKATRVFFQNEDDLNEFVKEGIIPSKKAFLVGPTGVVINYFAPA